MPPAMEDVDKDAGQKPFRKETANAVVVFDARGDELKSGDESENGKPKLRMAFKTCYDPPVVTFRFHVSVFSHGSSKKRQKTTLYLDIPRHNISSLEQTNHVDTTAVPELGRDATPQLLGGVTRVQFLLNRPGHLIQPIEELSLKPASQRILQLMTLLATVREFVIFMPHTTWSRDQFQYLQQAITSPISFDDQQKLEKEHDWWLGALYGGAGGKVSTRRATTASPLGIQCNDESTASESGDSTVATATPPAYKRSGVADDRRTESAESTKWTEAPDPSEVAAAASPPPYQVSEPRNGELASAAETPKKRLRESAQIDVKSSRRRLGSESLSTNNGQTRRDTISGDPEVEKQLEANPQLSNAVAMFLSKFNEVLRRTQYLEEENSALKVELCAMRETQDQMNAELQEMRSRNHAHVEKRMQDLEDRNTDLETQITDLGQCHDSIEERQAELEERQGKMEEKCDNIEVEIVDQVHMALKNRLIDALETM